MDGFFRQFAEIGEAPALFGKHGELEQAKGMKREHLIALTSGDDGKEYVQKRIKLGCSTAGMHLRREDLSVHFISFIAALLRRRFKHLSRRPRSVSSTLRSFQIERVRAISPLQEAKPELATPVLQVRERLLVLPIIGMIDTQRAQQLTEGLLRGILEIRARVVFIDITGPAASTPRSPTICCRPSRRHGSVIITGLSADVAQTLTGSAPILER
jgi:rsbT co-antagonist protein RsbR